MVSRRQFLKSGSATLAAGAAVGLSGCAGMLGESGGPGYTAWLYAPGTFESRDHYTFTYLDPSTFSDNEEELGDTYTLLKNSEQAALEPAGVTFENLDGLLSVDPATVYVGSFDADSVTGSLEDSGFSRRTEHEGHAIYAASDGSGPAFGVSDDTVVAATDGANGEDVVTTVLDAESGNGDRYVDENEDLKALTDELGEPTYVNGRTRTKVVSTDVESGEFAGEVANGAGFSVDGDTTDVTVALVFDSPEDVSTDEVEQWTETDTFDTVEDAEVSSSGRVATVTGTATTSEFFG